MAEKKYIECEAAIEEIDNSLKGVFVLPVGKSIMDRVSAADVKPVVLCKDCIHRRDRNRQSCQGRRPDFFCADGKKREES